jgi:dienelactone hydrolase
MSSGLAESVVKAKTERGEEVEVIEDFPAGSGPFPTVVLAPGGVYHARAPIPDQVSKSLAASGIAVLRFNWSYFPQDGRSGRAEDDWSVEVADTKAVLERARADPRVDKSRIVLAGKSRGSIAAWHAFRSTPEAKAAALLTPVCSRVSKENPTPQALDHYRGSALETRPVLMIAGDRDPFCSSRILYRYAASFGAPLRLAVIAGNHSLESGDRKDAAMAKQNAVNVDLATRIATDFILAVFR